MSAGRTFIVLLLGLLFARRAPAAEPSPALFVLIVGVNQSVDPSLPKLRYADDDAARYLELFRTLGARTYLVSRLDDNTRRLHPQAAAEARPPLKSTLEQTVGEARADVAQAHARGLPTAFYLVYAGHGAVVRNEGAVSLEDGWLSGHELEFILERAHADRSHVIVDACYSYFLAFGRGPGGDREPARGFSRLERLAGGSVGLLLSTSSARESHEWEAIEAGVFSHEVRSGLYGAADADHDGYVSYREIGAFIERANATIRSERYRPDVFARPPRDGGALLDLRAARRDAIEVEGSLHAHYMLEDARGVRVLDFHNTPGEDVALVRPGGEGPLYLRAAEGEREYTIVREDGPTRVAALEPATPRTHPRGAANLAFTALFERPFDAGVVDGYRFREPLEERRSPPQRRAITAYSLFALAGAAAVSALAVGLAARARQDDFARDASQREAAALNETLRHYTAGWGTLVGVAGAAAVTGTVLLLAPDRAPRGTSLSLSGSF